MASLTIRFPRILTESQRLNSYSLHRMMSGTAAVGTPGEGAGKGGGAGGNYCHWMIVLFLNNTL